MSVKTKKKKIQVKKPAQKIKTPSNTASKPVHKAVPSQKTLPATKKAPTITKPVFTRQTEPKPSSKAAKTKPDYQPLDLEEKEDSLEEKIELAKGLREDEETAFDASFVPTDTSERYFLVVDEEGKRRTETITIISQILPNAVIEVADDPEEALEIMHDCDFDTYVVNFLMPGYSASSFVKAVANHPDHPLLLGFAADKISDAVDPKKGLKIIPLKRLFDLSLSITSDSESAPAATLKD